MFCSLFCSYPLHRFWNYYPVSKCLVYVSFSHLYLWALCSECPHLENSDRSLKELCHWSVLMSFWEMYSLFLLKCSKIFHCSLRKRCLLECLFLLHSNSALISSTLSLSSLASRFSSLQSASSLLQDWDPFNTFFSKTFHYSSCPTIWSLDLSFLSCPP